MSEKKQVTKDELNKVTGGTESLTYYYTKECPQCKKKTLNCTDVVTPGYGVYTRESCSFCRYKNSYVDLY